MLDDALAELHDAQLKIVLGHHPIDWFDDDHIPPIRSILGRHNALYLHGHLHKSRVSPEDGAGYGFLCVQSGATFQSRADEKWVNGLLLAELMYSSGCLHLQPREWNPANRDWSVSKDLPERRKIHGSDWWAFPLPINKTNEKDSTTLESFETCLRYPTGWQIIDSGFISRQKEATEPSNYLNYFDGSEPDWKIASSESIPKRAIVKSIVEQILNYDREGKPQVVLIYGPIGEGKTTAIMQTIVSLLESDVEINILWNQNNTFLKQEEVLGLPKTNIPWLFVSDSGDLIAKDIKDICQSLTAINRNDIRFLICCRDTDWKAANANSWHWNKFSYFSNVILSGLYKNDAREIVKLWFDYGKEGLGELYGLGLEAATNKLVEAAHSESARREGALIGAILQVRYGNLLKEHVKSLLERLSLREVPGGSTLLDAFCYVAAMHVEGLKYLSRPVLAEALCCPLDYLNSHVLTPLGMEAATSTDGQFILTRHKEIAEASIELMSDVFHINLDQIYYDLINAAMIAKFNNHIPLLSQWIYSYPGHFSKKGRFDLAIKFGVRILEKTPSNSTLICSLSVIFRASGNRFEAVDLFRNYKGTVFEPRGYYSEWGAAEGAYGNYYHSVVLLIYSMSDQVSKLPPRKQIAIKVFSSFFEFFKEVERKYIDNKFLNARHGAIKLKKLFFLKKEIELSSDIDLIDTQNNISPIEEHYDNNHIDVNVEFSTFIDNIYFTIDYFSCDDDFNLFEGIAVKDFTFNGLLRLLNSAADKIKSKR